MSEYPLNVQSLMIPYSECYQKAGRFSTEFKTVSGKFPHIQCAAVLADSLKELRESIDIPDGQSDYITGVRIGYGLDKQNEIVLYFSPLYGVLPPGPGTGSVVKFDLSETSGDFLKVIERADHKVYEVEGERLVNIMDEEDRKARALGNLLRYRSDILITTPGGERPWNDTDVKSIFFTFQEIQALQDMYGEDRIYFISGLEEENSMAVHTIILSHLNPHDVSHAADKVANMANMCPPQCGSVVFAL